MRRRAFLGTVGAATVSVSGCASRRSKREIDAGSVDQVDYADRGAWPMGGRDAANTARNPVVGPDESASVQLAYDDASREGGPSIVGSQSPIASTPAVIDGTVYVPSGAVDPADGSVEWTAGVLSSTPPTATPALAHGHAYHTASEATEAVDIETGEARWSVDVGHPDVDPVVDGDSVLGASRKSDEGLVVFGAESGERQWTYPHERERFTGVAVTEDHVYAAETSGGDGRVTALDPETGEPVWSESVASMNVGPVATDEGVMVGTRNGRLHAFDADGSARWSRAAVSEDQGFVSSRPAVGEENVFVPPNNGTTTTALDLASGDVVWEQQRTDVTVGAPAVGEDVVYVGTREGIDVRSRDDGELEFTIDGARVGSDLVLVDGQLYFASGSSVFVVR